MNNEARATAKAMIVGSLIPILMARAGDTDNAVNRFECILDAELDKVIAAERGRVGIVAQPSVCIVCGHNSSECKGAPDKC